MKRTLFISLMTCGLAAGAHAAGPIPQGLLACEKISNTEERAHCYDDQLAGMKAEAAAAQSAPATAPPARAAATTPAQKADRPSAPAPHEEKFGVEQLPAPDRPHANPKDSTLVSTITSIKSMDPDIWLITLANGQVWRQEGTQTTSFFRVTDSVRLKKGVLGDYRLSTDRLGSKNWVLVNRIR